MVSELDNPDYNLNCYYQVVTLTLDITIFAILLNFFFQVSIFIYVNESIVLIYGWLFINAFRQVIYIVVMMLIEKHYNLVCLTHWTQVKSIYTWCFVSFGSDGGILIHGKM